MRRHGRDRACAPTLHTLENRTAPVVGAFAEPAPVTPGGGFDGVVRIEPPFGGVGSGTLLAGGRHVLTAAHVVDQDGNRVADGPTVIRFDLPSGPVTMTVGPEAVYVAQGWVGEQGSGSIPRSGRDWAVLMLPVEAPGEADRYDLYRGGDEVGRTFTLVGYGTTGRGGQGANKFSAGTKRAGENTFDGTSLNRSGDRLPPGLGLVADFDDGTAARDAGALQFGQAGAGLGPREASIAAGDSGGPAFIGGPGSYRVAGVASFALTGGQSDIDYQTTGAITANNSSFGDFFGYTRVSAFAAEIDAALSRLTPGDAPLRRGPAEPAPAADDSVVATGSDSGGGQVTLRDAGGPLRLEGQAFASGGARVATADVTGDGVPDLVAVPGPGPAPFVKVYDGKTGSLATAFLAFEQSFAGGLFVAAADFDRDGRAEVAVSPDQGGGPRVRVFALTGTESLTQRSFANFFGIDDPAFRGGARLGAGDVSGDGTPDLLVGAGFGGGPRLALFDGAALGRGPAKLTGDFFVFEPSLRNGVFPTLGDLNGDGHADLVFGGGPGGGPRVTAYDGARFFSTGGRDRTPLADAFVGDPSGRGGVRVAVKQADDDGPAELVVGTGEGQSAQVFLVEPGVGNARTIAALANLGGQGVFVG